MFEMQAPRVKICGITRAEDAERAVELGAWALGLIFAPSPRRCGREQALEIVRLARRRIELCGVFVNAHLDEVSDTADSLGLTLIQLHGDEGPAYCAEAARRTGARVIKAAAVRSGADLQALRSFATHFHLLDGVTPGLRGGGGRPFDWRLVGQHRGAPLIVSGGLTPVNVADAIAATKPFAVDTASGTESAPGIKDPALLQSFIAAVAASTASASADTSVASPPRTPVATERLGA
jgi:phosphoribosylanthranilate isomerase